MSAGAQDQRKNQLPQGNAPKEGGVAAEPEASFDAWRPQQQQQQPSYSTAMTGMASADPYMSSYYGGAGGYPPYQAFGVGDGAWSNGGDHLAFMGGYSQPTVQADSYMDGMFGGQGFGGFGQPGFNYGPFHGNGDYSGWGGGGGAAGRKYDDYYRGDPATYGADERAVKQVEQGMQRLSVDAGKHDPRIYGDLAPAGGPQKKSWASVASQPARAVPLANKMVMPLSLGGRDSIGMWDGKNGGLKPVGPPAAAAGAPPRPAWMAPRGRGAPLLGYPPHQAPPPHQPAPPPAHPVLDELRDRNEYNPKEFDVNPKNARFFVIKSYSEDDIHRAIKYEIWCSTEHGNKRLDAAFRERDGKGPVYLLFSVNGSGHFCGMAQMLSSLDYNASSSVWAQDKWKGQFKVKWVYVKDVPNSQLRHIRLENNENKPVTNSRDTQEVPPDKGRQVLKIIHGYGHRTSIFDDFVHYEQRQEEEEGRKPHPHAVKSSPHEEDDHTSGRGERERERDRGRGPRN